MHEFVKSIADVALWYKDGVKGERIATPYYSMYLPLPLVQHHAQVAPGG